MSKTYTDAEIGAAVRVLLATVGSAILGGAVAEASAATPPAEAEKPKATRTKAADKPAETPKTDEKPAEDTVPGITSAEVLQAILGLAGKAGKPAAEAVLQKFSASKVSELDPGDYQAVLNAIEEAGSETSFA